MTRRATFVPYQPKTILNRGKRADHWFWTRYSAYPYIGCQHGCEFCYCRERKYCPHDDPQDFPYVIKAKVNAPALLRRALARVPVDLVFTGDYQPAERKFTLSRQMLEVCCELGFPVFILSRSPLVLRDLDLLQAINERTRAVVAFSIISTPDSASYERVCRIERLAPPAAKRFVAMERIARAGIVTGTCMMPILPGLCDDEANSAQVVRWTADHGGRFVLAGGLTLADQQKEFFLGVLRERFPDLLPLYQRLYPHGSYGAVRTGDPHAIGLCIRELCRQAGIADRVPRPIIPGEKRALNKQVVEVLADRVYAMELNGEPASRVWAVRKAAWAIEDLEQDLGRVYRMMGLKGLQSIRDVGSGMACEVERLLLELKPMRQERSEERTDKPDGTSTSESRL
jgi:DNA repair photolyase